MSCRGMLLDSLATRRAGSLSRVRRTPTQHAAAAAPARTQHGRSRAQETNRERPGGRTPGAPRAGRPARAAGRPRRRRARSTGRRIGRHCRTCRARRPPVACCASAACAACGTRGRPAACCGPKLPVRCAARHLPPGKHVVARARVAAGGRSTDTLCASPLRACAHADGPHPPRPAERGGGGGGGEHRGGAALHRRQVAGSSRGKKVSQSYSASICAQPRPHHGPNSPLALASLPLTRAHTSRAHTPRAYTASHCACVVKARIHTHGRCLLDDQWRANVAPRKRV